jgi:hypothetical protein
MSRRSPHVVKTVDLPSGKTLEVIHPENGEPYTRVKPAAPAADRDLVVCEACRSELVEPTNWEAAGPQSWRVAMRCPNCEHCSEGVFSQECVDRFDERLDDACAVMVADLRRLEQANMLEDAERFIAALSAGAILPEDFDGGAR